MHVPSFQSEDHRGRAVRIPTVRLTRRGPPGSLPLARSLLFVHSRASRLLVRGGAAVTTMVAAAAWAHDPGETAVVLSLIALALVALTLYRGREGTGLAHRMSPRMDRFPAVCLACEYDLAGLPVEADGCTVCPECGAAWRVGKG